MLRAVLLAAVLLVTLPPSLALGAGPASLPDVEDEVMCPVCGTPLNLAESPQADAERAFIRDLIAQGKTKQEIKDALVAQYGDAVLAVPKTSGFGLTAYLVPAGLGLLALVLLALAVPRWRRRSRAGPPAAPAISPADARRLDDDLERQPL
ncbi:MAG: cytochrome c-type biogenesis protein [Solirubrobacteraceae bacterium]